MCFPLLFGSGYKRIYHDTFITFDKVSSRRGDSNASIFHQGNSTNDLIVSWKTTWREEQKNRENTREEAMEEERERNEGRLQVSAG